MAIPIANTGADILLAYSAAPLSQALDGTASSDPDGGAIVGYSWQLLAKPPGSTASILNPTSATPTLQNIDVQGTYRCFLIVEDDGTGNGGVHEFSESDILLAPDTAFVQVVMKTQYNDWRIPASGERGWADHLYTPWIDVDSISAGAPTTAPYLTDGAVAGLSAEVNVQSIGTTVQFITNNPAVTPLVAKATAGQSANVFEVRNSAGTGVCNADVDGNLSLLGTTLQLNRDAVASNKEVVAYTLRSGDAQAAPNDDLIVAQMQLEAELEEVQFHATRDRNGAGAAFQGITLVCGKTGELVAHESAIKWTCSDGGASKSIEGVTDANNETLSFVGDAGITIYRWNRMDLHIESGLLQSDSNFDLVGVADQQIVKTGAGNLKVGADAGTLLFRAGGSDCWQIDSTTKAIQSSAGPYKIEGVNTPTAANDAANKSYVDGQARYDVRSITNADSPFAAAHKYLVLCDASAGVITVNMPAPSTSGDQITVKKNDGSGNAITVSGNGNTIDGAASQSLAAQGDKITVVSDGTNWFSI